MEYITKQIKIVAQGDVKKHVKHWLEALEIFRLSKPVKCV